MKTKILTILFILFSVVSFTQEDIIKPISWIKPTSLPFYSWNSGVIQVVPYAFHYKLWTANTLNSKVWVDLGLTVTEEEDLVEGWQSYDIIRTFTPTNGDYKLFTASIGCSDYGKNMLVTVKNNDNYIDAIDVATDITIQYNNNYHNAYTMQWTVSKDMKVTVYQLKPTSKTPLMYDSSISFPLQAQRIDKVYQISSTGKFTLISTKLYKPKSYPLSSFIDKDYAIRLGGETPIQ